MQATKPTPTSAEAENAAAHPSGPVIELRGASKTFATPGGGRYRALRDLDVVIGDGECCAVVGPTGCGKSSTTLILVSGLDATTGEVLVHGEPVRGIGKDIGFMFQNDARLLVEDGAGQRAGGSEVRGRPMRQARTEGRDWLRRVGLAGFEDRYPHQLAAGIERACEGSVRPTSQPKTAASRCRLAEKKLPDRPASGHLRGASRNGRSHEPKDREVSAHEC